MRITDLLSKEHILLSMAATNKNAAMLELATLLAPTINMKAEELHKQLIDREAVRGTGYGKSVAIPHTIRAKDIGVAIGRCNPIDWGSSDKQPVSLIIMVVSPPKRFQDHLAMLSTIAKILIDDTSRQKIIAASTADEILAIFNQHQPLRVRNDPL